MTACALCGAETGSVVLGWLHEPGPEPRWLCPDCARRHVREIEAKLAPEWWLPDT